MKSEWLGRAEFAEVAEPLGITTAQVFAVMPSKRLLFVFFTHPDEHSREVYCGTLARDDDGVLHLVGDPVLQPGFFETIERDMRERRGGS